MDLKYIGVLKGVFIKIKIFYMWCPPTSIFKIQNDSFGALCKKYIYMYTLDALFIGPPLQFLKITLYLSFKPIIALASHQRTHFHMFKM